MVKGREIVEMMKGRKVLVMYRGAIVLGNREDRNCFILAVGRRNGVGVIVVKDLNCEVEKNSKGTW